MTQMRRQKAGGKDQKRTLVCVAAAVFCTVVLVVLFLQIDSWPTKHNHARMIKPPGLTPGVVGTALLESITTKQQQQQQRGNQQQHPHVIQEVSAEAAARMVAEQERGKQNLRHPHEQSERRPIPIEAQEEAGKDVNEKEGVASPEEGASGDVNGGDVASPEQQQVEEQQQPPQQLQSRTFVMELENLKPDASNSGSTSGTVVFETRAEWAPIGVQHFHDLVDAHFYDQCRFFRVVDNFVVQFGLAADPTVQAQWKGEILKDDAVVTTNAPGTLTYATSGKDTRTTQLFINTNKKGNKFLDAQGFSPFALITKGMEHVYRINNEYGEKPGQGKISNQGNVYLQQEFPHLSYINVIRPATAQD